VETITVYNSSRRGWLIALSGLVLAALALDLLVWNSLVAGLAERVFQDPGTFFASVMSMRVEL